MKYFHTTALVALSALLVSCSTDQLPAGAEVSVTPKEKTVEMKGGDPSIPVFCFIDENTLYQDVPVLISVADSEGSPMGNAEVGVYADFSGNTFSGPDVLQVYADKNGNGVVDVATELVSGSESGVYKTKTDQYDGTAMVFVRMNLTCPYSGEVYVFAGASSAQVDLTVTYSNGAGTEGTSTGEETTGGETTGGETTGAETTGGETTGAVTTGGETTGAETTGGEATGGTTAGADSPFAVINVTAGSGHE